MPKKKTSRSARKPAGSVRTETSTPIGRQNLILENMQAQMTVVIESVTSVRDALERRLDEQDKKQSARSDAIELAVRSLASDVRKNSDDIRTMGDAIRTMSDDIRKNTEDIRKNSDDIRALGDKLDTRADASRIAAIETRVEALESAG